MKKRGFRWDIFAISLIIVYFFAFVGSQITAGNTDSEWYNSVKPSFTPPNWVFPVVWNILFLFIAISLYLSWVQTKTREHRIDLVIVFGINLVLNVLWSYAFFRMQNPILAFIDLAMLVVSIVSLILLTYKLDKTAAYLLIPYLIWVIFAGVLNFIIAF